MLNKLRKILALDLALFSLDKTFYNLIQNKEKYLAVVTNLSMSSLIHT